MPEHNVDINKKENNNSSLPKNQCSKSVWLTKMFHPKGKTGVVVSILVAIAFVLTVNALAYQYLEAQPPRTDAFKSFSRFRGIQTWNTGVDTLLFGDSSCGVNLDTGTISDRLGGRAAKLTSGGIPILMDAWLLSAYVERFGAPDNVVICHTAPTSYNRGHPIESIAAPPLPWNYWNELGVAPDWQEGELRELFITKYGVLYSYGDILRERLVKFWRLFRYTDKPRSPTKTYSIGSTKEQELMDISSKGNYYAGEFSPSSDTTNAFSYMSNLAREKNFQLYILFQPEWDKAIDAGLRKPILHAQVQYLSQFVDPTYVHIVRNESLIFTKAQMQNPNHLRPGAARIKADSDISRIVSIQNQLTDELSQPLKLDSLHLDKDSYQTGEQPLISLTVSNLGAAGVTGGVSCLAKPSGTTDGCWVSRAPAVDFELEADGKVNIKLELTVGKLDEAGVYDLIVFLRQDVGNLSNEVRVELPGYIKYSDI